MAAKSDPIAALGGTSFPPAPTETAFPPDMLERIDDLISEEIAKMPQGYRTRPIRDPADKQRIVDLLTAQGYPPDAIAERLKQYEGEGDTDYDDSDMNTFEVPPESKRGSSAWLPTSSAIDPYINDPENEGNPFHGNPNQPQNSRRIWEDTGNPFSRDPKDFDDELDDPNDMTDSAVEGRHGAAPYRGF